MLTLTLTGTLTLTRFSYCGEVPAVIHGTGYERAQRYDDLVKGRGRGRGRGRVRVRVRVRVKGRGRGRGRGSSPC